MAEQRTLNINVGVLGHVDSGKTSLVAAMSTTLSTAALDKHPQSQERGITLDLGFSSFTVPAPDHVRAAGYDALQFTLVDCPGHASLIRTIIGGAQIMDMMLLVVDVTKGIQPQTAECIVIGECVMATSDLVVALNKTDLLPPEKRDRYLRKAQKMVAQTLEATKFAGATQVAVAARPAAAGDSGAPLENAAGAAAGAAAAPQGVQDVVAALLSRVRPRPPAAASGPFLFYVDHCFAIKGQGTVLTGTVVRGSVRAGDVLELPELRQQRKVKSIQVFRRPVASAGPGDRAGVCVTQLDAKLVERGLACDPGTVPTFTAAVAAVAKIRFFAGDVRSRARLHVTIGPATVMAELLFFGLPDGEGEGDDAPAAAAAAAGLAARVGQVSLGGGSGSAAAVAGRGQAAAAPAFDLERDYLYQEELYGFEGRPASSGSGGGSGNAVGPASSSCDQGQQQGQGQGQGQGRHQGLPQWCYLRFSQPVTAPADSLVIGSRLDADAHGGSCRLAFHGRLCLVSGGGGTSGSTSLAQQQPQQQPKQGQRQPQQQQLSSSQQQQQQAEAEGLQRRLRIYKPKRREGLIERVEGDGRTAVCRGMFQRETDLSLFQGMEVVSGCGQRGTIEGGFGKSGKFRVAFRGPVAATAADGQPSRVVLSFRKRLFDADRRRMVQ